MHASLLQVKSVVMINCGGCQNVLELLQPTSEEVRFYIIDRYICTCICPVWCMYMYILASLVTRRNRAK